jgi:CRP-like cAMP-binding protein
VTVVTSTLISPISQLPAYLEKLEDLCKLGTLHSYSKGEIILRTDSQPPGVFVVKEGYVKVYSITDSGEENLHIIYGPDMIFPLIWAVTGRLRQIFYEAMDDTNVYRVAREDFLACIIKEPETAAAILYRAMDMVNEYADRVDNLQYTKASSRIAYRLLSLAEQFGKPENGCVIIMAPVKHHDIANSSNCSRETASREMEKLEKKGYIRHKNHLIVLCNLEQLRKEVSGT